MADEEEPSILEYARFYELTTDYRDPHPLLTITQSLSMLEEPTEPDLFEISAEIARPFPERLNCEKGAIALLLSIQDSKSSPLSFRELAVPQTHRVRDLKIELPLLRSDHELDVQQFVGRNVPNLANDHLPLEKVDDERDEGLSWPSSYIDYQINATARSVTEKIDVSKDVVLYIRDILQHHDIGGEPLRFDSEVEIYERSKLREPMTPPVLPMSPEILPFVPSSDICHLELLSEHTSPIRQELHELESIILRGDSILPQLPTTSTQDSSYIPFNSDNIGDLYSPLKDLKVPPPLPTYRRPKAEDLKVDGPLTPPQAEIPPPWKQDKVAFSEVLVQIIPELPTPIPKPEDTYSDDIERFFTEVVRPIAEQADFRIEQEQLQEADTTKRVKVPIMDFTRPLPPWASSMHRGGEGNTWKVLLLDLKREHIDNHSWPISSKAQRALPWDPFPKGLAQVAEREVFERDETLEDWITPPESIDPSTLVWKPDGLRILDVDEHDSEDIDIGHFSEMVDLRSLIRKRKIDLLEKSEYRDEPAKCTARNRNSAKPSSTIHDILSGSFSAYDALNTFTSIRTGDAKRPKLEETTYFSTDAPNAKTNPIPTDNPSIVIPSHAPPPQRPPPLPTLQFPTTTQQFIISAHLLSNRPLFHLLQTLHPTADFISRDFSLHHRIHPPPFPPNPIPPPPTTLANEADILLSPSTGLLLTTLQNLAQRPLPGATGLSPLFTRIRIAAPRYEQLLILVSDSAPCATVPASLAPLVELHAFCAALPLTTTPSVILVPNSGSGDGMHLPLATYIVYLMISHSHSNSAAVPYLQERETDHEIFLRRAGLNAFAAQTVLAELRPPELKREWGQLEGARSLGGMGDGEGGFVVRDGDRGERTLWGLAAFVRMGGQERVRRWQGEVGRGLLERVGRVVDERWG